MDTRGTLSSAERFEASTAFLDPTTMSFTHAHNLTIDRSNLYNIEGDYNYNPPTPGKQGIILLRGCDQNLRIISRYR